ncbi:cryptochrome/photolyase family protein [Haloprofundus salilacus]|uniref:cryptochrome/photolyase family protein n=1 Tax=Haloprofundus salilacus TaxID=2876190 RepID=UPI001CCC44E0|nr:deoxyribodipyrimidine photo-lyase [Haloprofundus salilacus]
MQLHWHRRDLRVSDNRALAAAAEDAERRGEVVPVFVFDDLVLEHAAASRVRYMLDALAELRERYRGRGSDLVAVRGDPSTLLVDLAEEFDAERVVWNDDYSGLAEERDEAVRDALSEAGIEYESFCDQVHHEPGEIRTNAGDPYSVFTYFWKKWRDRDKDEPYPEPGAEQLASIDEDEELPIIEELGFEEPEATIQSAGTDVARERLATFCDDAIFRYAADRDYPARGATSRLSADLKWGTIGIREVYEATERAKSETDSDEAASVEEFRSQLAWREFYTQVLYFNQRVVSENYKSYENDVEWRDDEEGLQAWKDGKTGYPIVDAGMRQLREEAFMHNRLRMVVASFLTKDLLVDWREGYDHFRTLLADHDTGNDNGGWQWAASTGTDAQPYFRVFNPMTQGERYDPDAEYIRRYVPELAGVDADTIHSWHELLDEERGDAAPDYPDPIVDHAERREEAISMFERARGGAEE